MQTPNYYRILGVTTAATTKELIEARKRRALETHPDHGGRREDFELVCRAFTILSQTQEREVWERAYRAEAGAKGHVVCENCFSVNRVRGLRDNQVAHCAACGTKLLFSESDRQSLYGDALRHQIGDLLAVVGAEGGSLAADMIRAGAEAIRRKLGITKRTN
jgi:curved DNA-binding protein CbpA